MKRRDRKMPEFGYGPGLSTDIPHPNIPVPIRPKRRRAVVDPDPNDEPPDDRWVDDEDGDDYDPLPLNEIYPRN